MGDDEESFISGGGGNSPAHAAMNNLHTLECGLVWSDWLKGGEGGGDEMEGKRMKQEEGPEERKRRNMTESGGRENAHAKIGLGGRILPEKYLDIKVFVLKASVLLHGTKTGFFFQGPFLSFRLLNYTMPFFPLLARACLQWENGRRGKKIERREKIMAIMTREEAT